MSETGHATASAATPRGGIPLVLAPLLEPYRGSKHLGVRVERLPAQARLSRGNNNGDHTWSLRSDELDGLLYLPPNHLVEPHRLAVRVISLDGEDAATLALLDVSISTREAQLGPVPDAGEVGDADDADIDAALGRLRGELAELKASLAAREAELVETRQQVERASAEHDRQTIEAALGAARAAWQAELEQRMAAAAAGAARSLDESRAAFAAELAARLAQSEEEARQRLTEAEARGRRETEAALTQAAEAWKAEEAVRLAAAAEQWREQSERALAEAKARFALAEAALAEPSRPAGEPTDKTTPPAAPGLELKAPSVHPSSRGWAAAPEAERAELRRIFGTHVKPRKAIVGAIKGIRASRIKRQGRLQLQSWLALGAAMLVVSGAVMLYPNIEPMLREYARPKLASPAIEAVSSNREVGPPNQKPAANPAPVVARRTIIGASGVNLRAGPSTATAVITTLPRDAEVMLIERRGAWALIRLGVGNGTRNQEGWVHGSTLKDVAGP